MILKQIIPYLNYTQLFVVVTFLLALLYLPKSRKNKILLAILFVCFINEVVSFLFLLCKFDNGLLYTINILIHNCLWLLLVLKKVPNSLPLILSGYIVFAFLNLLFFEGIEDFNYNTFMVGSFIYLFTYIFISFSNLRKENFAFFNSNEFILLSTPILLFFGLSFIFAFRSSKISETIIFGNTNTYQLIGVFINIVYYTLINIYILKERNNANT
jgi:hypothetical protein